MRWVGLREVTTQGRSSILYHKAEKLREAIEMPMR
jgi:hypothetical protein